MHQGQIFVLNLFFLDFQLLFQSRKSAVAQFGCLFVVTLSLGNFNLASDGINLLTQLGKLLNGSLFIFPLRLAIVQLFL